MTGPWPLKPAHDGVEDRRQEDAEQGHAKVTPTGRRCPASGASGAVPAAKYGGTMWTKHAEVIRIGRNRTRAASTAASNRTAPSAVGRGRELDDQDGVLARQTDQDHEADLHENVDVHAAEGYARQRARKHIGTTRTTASGSDQLPYGPASTKKTSTAPSTNGLTGSAAGRGTARPCWTASAKSSARPRHTGDSPSGAIRPCPRGSTAGTRGASARPRRSRRTSGPPTRSS